MPVGKTWNAAIVAPADTGDGQPPDCADELLELLSDYSPALTCDPGQLGARVWIEAPDALAAAAIAVSVWTTALQRAGIKADAPVRIKVASAAEMSQQLSRPNFPALVGVSEVADLLAVSRARASEVARNTAGFPAPVAQLAAGPVWLKTSVVEFLSQWPRRPGRPQRRETVHLT